MKTKDNFYFFVNWVVYVVLALILVKYFRTRKMNLYIGNLAYTVREQELREFFEQCGEVSSAKVISDKMSGRSKGFGFVEMPNDAEGNKAIETLDGKELNGRPIRVNEARPKD